MLLQEKLHPIILEINEEQQNSEVEPEYIKTLFFDHSHLMIDFDNLDYK